MDFLPWGLTRTAHPTVKLKNQLTGSQNKEPQKLTLPKTF
jgi:hypothetical protein